MIGVQLPGQLFHKPFQAKLLANPSNQDYRMVNSCVWVAAPNSPPLV